MVNYCSKKIVIVGMGITGLSCVMFFLKRGVIPRVMDSRKLPPYLNKFPNNIKYCLGEINEKWLLDSTLIVLSPGVSLAHPSLVIARKAGIEIVGDIELFVREVITPIVAITGTNGKSTVTKLMSDMAVCSGLRVAVGGNIGIPVLTLLDNNYQLYVLELSSFQLETIYSLRANVSTVLNISNEHTDRYPLGLQEYCNVKLRIYHRSILCVVNILDSSTFPLFSKRSNCIYFGDRFSKFYIKCRGSQKFLMSRGEKLLNFSEIKIIGYHNYVNVLSALTLASSLGISDESCLKALRRFTGLPHRLELIHNNHGIRWINDSKSTNIASTRVALRSLMPFLGKGKLHLLLGGDSKLADFRSLNFYIHEDNIFLYCFGKDGKNLATTLHTKNIVLTSTMTQSIQIIRTRVCPKDIILLSPACSSTDQFQNFKMRGKIFTILARQIINS